MEKPFITTNPKILNGKPIIKGTRISVAQILQCLASGMSKEDILRGFPTLSEEGYHAALEFVSSQLQGEEFKVYAEVI